jgi:hypothetical protein
MSVNIQIGVLRLFLYMKETFFLTDKMVCHCRNSNNKFNVPDRHTAGCQFLVAQNTQQAYFTEESW